MPLTFDLPFEELGRYGGRNPRPDDFDAYWERALAEMRAVDPQVELRPAEFTSEAADCFHLSFTGVRGARVHAKLLRPRRAEGPGPAVLMFHGYSVDSGDWAPKLAWVSQGFTVAALDCRGQGGSSEDVGGVRGTTLHGHIIRGLDGPPDDLLMRHIFLDTAQLAGIVMAMDGVDGARVGATGASQGGGLTVACAALEPRVRRAAPVYPFLSDYRRVWEMDQAKGAYAELRSYFRNHDPTHAREDEVFARLGYIDIHNLAPRVRADVYWGIGLADEICPPSTQFAAYNGLGGAKTMEVYPDFAHESLKGHDDRVFAFLSGL